MTNGYSALKRGAAWLDLSERGMLAVHGPDRARLIHALTTNDILGLAPGQGCYAFFLNEHGRVLADANIYNLDGELLLDTEPETGRLLSEHIERYTIADDAAIRELAGELTTVGLEGPASIDVLRRTGVPQPGAGTIVPWTFGLVASASSTGQPGYRLLVQKGHQHGVISELESAGAVAATSEDARTVRIENGRPRYGEEISVRYLALETRQNHAIHPHKGCYLGQEVVERVRSRGLLARELTALHVETEAPPPVGTKLFAGASPAGAIVSSVFSPDLQLSACLAYIHVQALRPGTTVALAGHETSGATPRVSVVITR